MKIQMKSTLSIISDDILFCNLITTILTKDSTEIQIVVCSSYEHIKNNLEVTAFDLIIIDGGLTGLSSIELIHFIRMSKHIIAPIWFFPEILSDEYIHKALKTGASRIILKPFDPYQVTKEIVTLLSNSISLNRKSLF